MSAAEDQRLAEMFRHFARHEFIGHSPRYQVLAEFVADRPDLAAPLRAAPRNQRRAILYFAAVQYLLRTTAQGHPLSAYLPTLGGCRPADREFPAALANLVSSHRDELTALCATRATQTNEALRAALLRPGFGRAAARVDGRPLALVELGTSAGLLLISDRYACRYRGADDRVKTYGPAEVPESLIMTCSVRGPGWPNPAAIDLPVAARVGIDLSPIAATDPTATDWLRSCIWPEHTDRLTRLDAALAEVARIRPRLVAGDMVETLPAVVSGLDGGVVPCVFASNALTYLGRGGRRRLIETLGRIGAEQDLTVVLNEASSSGAELFLGRRPAQAGPPGVLSVGLLTVVAWRNGRAAVEVLARTGPHGQWLEWTPQEYAYQPAA